MTKARISDIVKNIKDGMNYPDRINDDVLNDEIGRMLSHTGYEVEVDDILTEKGLASNTDVIYYFYPAVASLMTLSTKKLTDYIYQELKSNDQSNNDTDIYDEIELAFNEYRKHNHNVSDQSIIFWSDIPSFTNMIVDVHNDCERNKSIDDAKNFRNPIDFMSEDEIITLLETALREDKINKIFSEVNKTMIKFRKEILSGKHSEDYEIAYYAGTELSTINSRFISFGINYI